MHYWGILKLSFVDGDGCRTVLFVSGCNHACEGCQNPDGQRLEYGEPFTSKTMDELLQCLKRPVIDGLTISGGDPMHPKNRAAVRDIARIVKLSTKKSVWLYTGYDFESIKTEPVLCYVDVVVDGTYNKDLPPTIYRGSNNQRIWKRVNGQWTMQDF